VPTWPLGSSSSGVEDPQISKTTRDPECVGAGNRIWFPGRGKNFNAPAHAKLESSKSALQRAQESVCTVLRSRGMDLEILLYTKETKPEARGAVRDSLLLLL
jgi:hypothetical protein